jgi:hypothetical protein
MIADVDDFDGEQRKLVASLVSDFGGPTMTPSLLYLLERVLYELNPDWDKDPQALSPETRKEVEACMAALQYLRVQNIAENPRGERVA